MLYLIGKAFPGTVARLLSSHLLLLSLGGIMAGILVYRMLPEYWRLLPQDNGKALVKDGMLSRGKPTGAGIIIMLVSLAVLVLVVPPDVNLYVGIISLMAITLCGFFDDRSKKPWGIFSKTVLDFLCSFIAVFALYNTGANNIWLPFTSRTFTLPLWMYLPFASMVLFVAINSVNCSDGIDGLAGSLGLMSLLSMSLLLYLVLGYKPVSEYLLLPHYPNGAKWAILSVTLCGATAGYLWHNAEPSAVLMGDAGSRMLGLAIGIATLATGNPFVVFVIAPVVVANGFIGILKLLFLKLFRRMGYDITPTGKLPPEKARKQNFIVRLMHRYTWPFHDHLRKNCGWKNSQILMRFVLLQALFIPVLFAILVKLR